MTQEDKELLLKDLCARLPYGVLCDCLHSNVIKADSIDTEDLTIYYYDCDEWEPIHYCKPYLRPMSSMTETEHKEYELLANRCIVSSVGFVHFEVQELIDWLNKNMFDYRGLIPKGLALEAPEGMYNN